VPAVRCTRGRRPTARAQVLPAVRRSSTPVAFGEEPRQLRPSRPAVIERPVSKGGLHGRFRDHARAELPLQPRGSTPGSRAARSPAGCLSCLAFARRPNTALERTAGLTARCPMRAFTSGGRSAPGRSAQMPRGRRGIPRYHPGRSLEGGFEGAPVSPAESRTNARWPRWYCSTP